MKKGERYIGNVVRVDYANKGIVDIEGENCVVKNVIPGQKVEIEISKKRTGRYEGRLIQVIEKADKEIVSPCPHFDVCGGCTYMNMEYEDQLNMKENQVKRLLSQVIDVDSPEIEFLPIKRSPHNIEYRNKMEFSFGDSYKDGPLALGLHKRGSFYDIENVVNCQLVDEDYRKILAFTSDYFKNVSFYHKMKHVGYLRHLLVRKAKKTGEILIALVTTSKPDEGMDADFINAWAEGIKNLELKSDASIKGILHIINDSLADVVMADSVDMLYGEDYITEELLGLKFKISTFSFFQTNSLGAEVLYSTARDFILSTRKEDGRFATVFDLYSGTGTIAQLMSTVAEKVIGVEIVEEAVEAAKVNAKLNGIDNCEFIANDVLKALDEIEDRPDFIILDPPRDGVNPKALKKIVDYGVDNLIYISCKPTSLVRDLELILGNGYQVKKVCCVDMFPNASHVETVVLLSKKHVNPKAYVEIGVDAEEYYKIKGEKH